MRKLLVGGLVLMVGLLGWILSTYKPGTVILSKNECSAQISEVLDAARSHHGITVPTFSQKNMTVVHCAAYPGFTSFEIKGIDTAGQDFDIYEKVGGKAASGADTIFDYCYMRSGNVISQTRLYGRDGAVSTSTCTYTR